MAVEKPFAYKVNRVTISGDCFNGAEVWSTGFYFGYTNADAADPAGTADDIAGYWSTFFTTAANKVGSAYRTLQVKVAQLGTDGKTDLDSIDYYDYPSPVVGVTATSVLPPQISLAATLSSDVQRGLGAKGRMYLPGVWDSVSTSTGKLGTTTPTNVSLNLKTMFDAINSDTDIPGEVILASHGHKTTIIPGGDIVYISPINTKVTGLRVGDVFDTQRRRRNDLPEVYVTRVLA
jgi:hypothetical protein